LYPLKLRPTEVIPEHYFDDFVEDLNDPDCVQEIYEFSLGQVRGMVDYNDEDDIVQDVFYRLTKWPMAKKYNSRRHYYSLLKITIRQSIAAYWKRRHSQRNDARKRRYISELHSEDSRTYEFEGSTESVFHRLQMKEMVKLVLKKVTTLKPKHRAIFQLRFIEDRSHEQIADLLKISLRTSYRLESQVRQRLHDYLGSDFLGSK
jgi:RNA polymerase sigma factor (sigma-70 family)